MQDIIEKRTNASVVIFLLLTIRQILDNSSLSFNMKAVFKDLVWISKHAMDAISRVERSHNPSYPLDTVLPS